MSFLRFIDIMSRNKHCQSFLGSNFQQKIPDSEKRKKNFVSDFHLYTLRQKSQNNLHTFLLGLGQALLWAHPERVKQAYESKLMQMIRAFFDRHLNA